MQKRKKPCKYLKKALKLYSLEYIIFDVKVKFKQKQSKKKNK